MEFMARDKVQTTATEQRLSKGPRSMTNSRFSGGKVQYGSTCVKQSDRPVPLQYNTGTRGGKIEYVATCIDRGMPSDPKKGFNSYSTPLSLRAEAQSKGGK